MIIIYVSWNNSSSSSSSWLRLTSYFENPSAARIKNFVLEKRCTPWLDQWRELIQQLCFVVYEKCDTYLAERNQCNVLLQERVKSLGFFPMHYLFIRCTWLFVWNIALRQRTYRGIIIPRDFSSFPVLHIFAITILMIIVTSPCSTDFFILISRSQINQFYTHTRLRKKLVLNNAHGHRHPGNIIPSGFTNAIFWL